MKRKNQINISTSSLRSSSSRRSRKRNNNSSNSTPNPKQSSTSSTSNNARVVGNSSNKSIFCKGCNNTFKIYSSVTTFINKHVKSNDKCPLAYPKCNGCGKLFYEESHLLSHKSKSPKSSKCYALFTQHQINTKYSSSEVQIPTVKKATYLPNEIPSHLNPLYSIEKDLMVSKIQPDYSSFHPTVKFQNMNVHNFKSIIPNQFNGHAIMDPNQLKMKKEITSSGIYSTKSEEINNNSNKATTNNHTSRLNEQLIEFGEFEDDFANVPVDINSDISVSSDDNSSISENNIPSNIVNTTNTHFSNNLLRDIIENEDNDDDSVVSARSIDISDVHKEPSKDNFISVTTSTIEDKEVSPPPQQQSIDIRDIDHFVKMKLLQEKELSHGICDKDYKDCLELVTILMKYNVPTKGIYEDLMKWKNKDTKLTSSAMTMSSLISKAKHRTHGQSISTKLSPIQTNLICPSGRRITVTSFDADALIYDLLSDANLMQVENLVFDEDNLVNPFSDNDNEYYSDFNNSEFYKETKKMKKIDPHTDLLVPIQLYMDETTLDSYSKLSLHPLVMTLLIFNRKTRNLSMSWRTVAYIPNFDASFQSKNYSVDMKYNDFHFCLRYLLNGIEKVISHKDGFNWNFVFNKFPNKVYKRRLKFVLGNVLGDAKGANVLCSRFNNNSTSHIARDCDVLTDMCDNPNHKCRFHQQKHLESMSTDNLRKLSFRKIDPYNAFSNLDFGANCYGINGACAADPCHMFNKGVVERLPKIFMARLTPNLVLALDKHVGALITNYANQSDRDYPNIKVFCKGVSSSAKLRSDQHIARVLVIYLVLLTPDFESIVIHKKGRKQTIDEPSTRITIDEYNQWIFIFEETLILHSWVYLDKHRKSFFNGGKESIVCDRLREYMTLFQKYALRKEGMGLKFLKFHQILHLWWIIRLFGSLYNVDTARCESHHKKKKNIGKQTQRRIELFDEQTSQGEYKVNLLIKAIVKANITLPKGFELVSSNCPLNNSTPNQLTKEPHDESSNSSNFLLTFDYENNSISAKWLSPKMKHKIPDFPLHILNGIFQKFKGYNHGFIGKRIKSIIGFTELSIPISNNKHRDSDSNNLVRACPYYQGEKNWFDWVSV